MLSPLPLFAHEIATALARRKAHRLAHYQRRREGAISGWRKRRAVRAR